MMMELKAMSEAMFNMISRVRQLSKISTARSNILSSMQFLS